MSALRQPGPHYVAEKLTTISKKNLSSIPSVSMLSRFVEEGPSISSHIALGDSGYHTLKAKSKRLITEDFKDDFTSLDDDQNHCQTEDDKAMSQEIDAILRNIQKQNVKDKPIAAFP